MSAGIYLIRPKIWCLLLLFLARGSSSLKALNITVPEIVKSGDSVTLFCGYDLEKQSLYSLKWYWKDQEFYRYVPKEIPPQRKFHLPHFTVDISRSSPTQVTLTDVRQEQSGEYTCEVSSDAPFFETAQKDATMTVGESSPAEAVTISVPEKVKSGDTVTLSCDYDLKQKPLFSIKWFWKFEEFYRYAPKMLPTKRYFPLPHFKIDIPHTGPTQVTLTDIRPEQTGRYACEVTYDVPELLTYRKYATMVVEESKSQNSKSPADVVTISVPEKVKSGDMVTLSCDYDLKQKPLFCVKWYWEFEEFYRYVPKMVPPEKYFPLPHFKFDISHSGKTQVTLKDIRPEQTGNYTCEVSFDAPDFLTYLKVATMTVEESSSKKLMISVPEVVKTGATVILSCEYDLEKEPLDAVKWYFKEKEFYRYDPKQIPQGIYFNLPHFNIDMSRSGANQVTLKEVRPEQTGRYKCEVSSDAPKFYTYQKSATMIVEESPPAEVLRISVPEVVISGDTVTLSCDYDLNQKSLLFIKWYWKAHEFYRYAPKMVPPKRYFPLRHFNVDIYHSGPSYVTLTNIRPEQTGNYTCEVTSDAPDFSSYQKHATMVVEESSPAKELRISVPELVKSGDTVILSCDYDLKKEPLLFVKWFWKQHEFYRYIPKMVPPKRHFPLQHFNVDISQSGPFQVTLTGVRKEQSGIYKCEIVSDAPFFNTIQRDAAMVIAELPSNDPVLTVHPERVEVGSKVEVECSVPGSDPPANMTLFLNGEKITEANDNVKILPKQFKTDSALGLESVKMKLEVVTRKSHFVKGIMVIKCKAAVFTLWNRTAETSVTEQFSSSSTSVSPQQKRTRREEARLSSLKGLKGLRISVPEVVKSGDTVTLSCEYDLQQVPLYSINWYWKGQEFYRYLPKESPPQRDFHVTHFNIDISRSGPTQVTLKGVRRELTGRYECEVSCDAPLFYTSHKNATMVVAELSQDDPVLSVQPDRVEIGNKVQAECSAPGSDPPANLTWLINDEEITEDNESVKIFPKKFQTDTALGLHSATIKLEVVTNRSHFINGIMVVKCEASVFALLNRSVELPVAEYFVQQFEPALDSVSSQQSQTKKEETDVIFHGSAEHASYSIDIIILVTLFNIICSR